MIRKRFIYKMNLILTETKQTNKKHINEIKLRALLGVNKQNNKKKQFFFVFSKLLINLIYKIVKRKQKNFLCR